MREAGWEQQQECERQRWEMLMAALNAAAEGRATQEQMQFIARECGITNWKTNAHAGTVGLG